MDKTGRDLPVARDILGGIRATLLVAVQSRILERNRSNKYRGKTKKFFKVDINRINYLHFKMRQSLRRCSRIVEGLTNLYHSAFRLVFSSVASPRLLGRNL